MGKLIYKKLEEIAGLFFDTRIYVSNCKSEVSLNQDIFDEKKLIHKNNVIVKTNQLKEIIDRIESTELC